jgi:hypothetical protein
MPVRPLPAESIPEHRLRELRLIGSDVDDTLTQDGKLPTEIIDALARLRAAGVAVWLVTGRCAAWGQALANYFDLDGVVAENGGVLCRGDKIEVLADLAPVGPRREKLIAVFETIRRRVPRAVESEDNLGRLTDWAFLRPPLSDADLAFVAQIAAGQGLRAISSSIHVHLFSGDHDKATGLAVVCERAGIVDRETVLTLGDSPNDVALFNPQAFPFSVGVANIAPSLDAMEHRPRFILPHARAEGALWLFRRILVSRGV